MARFIGSGKIKRIQIGSDKKYKGYLIQVFLKIELDKNVLNTCSYFQAEIEYGSEVYTVTLDRGLLIENAYLKIFDKVDKLSVERLKQA